MAMDHWGYWEQFPPPPPPAMPSTPKVPDVTMTMNKQVQLCTQRGSPEPPRKEEAEESDSKGMERTPLHKGRPESYPLPPGASRTL